MKFFTRLFLQHVGSSLSPSATPEWFRETEALPAEEPVSYPALLPPGPAPRLRHHRLLSEAVHGDALLHLLLHGGHQGPVPGGQGAQEAELEVPHQVHDVVPEARGAQDDQWRVWTGDWSMSPVIQRSDWSICFRALTSTLITRSGVRGRRRASHSSTDSLRTGISTDQRLFVRLSLSLSNLWSYPNWLPSIFWWKSVHNQTLLCTDQTASDYPRRSLMFPCDHLVKTS